MNKALIALVVLGAAAIGGVYYWSLEPIYPEMPVLPATSAQTGSPSSQAYEWIFEESPATLEGGTPQTKVFINGAMGKKEVGTFAGTCSEQTTDLLPDEKLKVVCWFAGGGNEVGVFYENGKDVIKVGDLDEGDPETGGFRGNFRTALELQ